MADDLDAQTKQVADAYWGTNQPRAARDAHGLGPPPRVLTEGMRRYIADAAPSMFGLWVGATVVFTLSHVITVIATHNLLFPPIAPVLFIVLAVISGRKRASERRRIERVVVDGVVTGAVVKNIHQWEQRRAVRTTVTYRVDGASRDSIVVSYEQGLAFLQVGLRDEVLYLADTPDVVIPTFLVA